MYGSGDGISGAGVLAASAGPTLGPGRAGTGSDGEAICGAAIPVESGLESGPGWGVAAMPTGANGFFGKSPDCWRRWIASGVITGEPT